MKQIELRNSIGEIVFDYLKIIESGDEQLAKKYLSKWVGDNINKKVWNGEEYVSPTISTLRFFLKDKNHKSIKLTQKLLDELRVEDKNRN